MINKIDLAPHVGADLEVMRRDSLRMRGERPFFMISLRQGDGVEDVISMGTRTARITAEDFVIPPSFGGSTWPSGPPARSAVCALQLVASWRIHHHGALLSAGAPPRYAAVSFRQGTGRPAVPPQPDRRLDGRGRALDRDCHANRDARAVVTGQSATRVHPAVSSFATQQWRVKVARGASLVVLPGPVIPYRRCRYYQRAIIELEEEAQLAWGDIWTPGRYSRGALSEQYEFERIVQELEVWRDGVLVYRDRFRWDGAWDHGTTRWYFGGGDNTGLRQPVRDGHGRSDRSPIALHDIAGGTPSRTR